MKYLHFFSIIFLFSCGPNNPEEIQYNEPKKVIVTGKVLNPDAEVKNIRLAVNRIGFGQEAFEAPLDDQGGFNVSFETYLPLDVWLGYQSQSEYPRLSDLPRCREQFLFAVFLKQLFCKLQQLHTT